MAWKFINSQFGSSERLIKPDLRSAIIPPGESIQTEDMWSVFTWRRREPIVWGFLGFVIRLQWTSAEGHQSFLRLQDIRWDPLELFIYSSVTVLVLDQGLSETRNTRDFVAKFANQLLVKIFQKCFLKILTIEYFDVWNVICCERNNNFRITSNYNQRVYNILFVMVHKTDSSEHKRR